MIKDHNFIVFSDDWGRHPSSCQHIFKRLARANRVLWVNTLGLRRPSLDKYTLIRTIEKTRDWLKGMVRINDNLWVYSPFMVPVIGPTYDEEINVKFLARILTKKLTGLGMEKPIFWTTVPNVVDVLGKLQEELGVYYCTDDYSLWPGGNRNLILQQEARLIKSVDLMFAASVALAEKGRREEKPTVYLSHGVDIEHFKKAASAEVILPKEIANIPKPIIGFFGLLWEKIDFSLIEKIATSYPLCSIVLIGKIATNIAGLRKFRNIYLLGEKNYEFLPNYVKAFTVCILPYLKDPQIEQSAPLKLKEYLSTGKPVVSISIPEVYLYQDYISITHNHEEFISAVAIALSESGSLEKAYLRQRAVEEESWERKTEVISCHLQEFLQARRLAYLSVPETGLKGENFLVFSDDWGRHPSSCQHIFKRISRTNKILWVDTIGLRKPRPNLGDLYRGIEKILVWIYRSVRKENNVIIYSPVMNPFYGIKFLRKLNQWLLVRGIKRQLAVNRMQGPILVTTVPNISDLLGYLGEKKSIYYCVDDFSQWPGMEKKIINQMEKELLEKVDLILVTSDKLFANRANYRRPIYKLEHGVDVEHFKSCIQEQKRIPEIISKIKRPIIGYFGLIDERIDLDLLRYVGLMHPDWSVMMIGKLVVNISGLRKLKNFHFLGNIPYNSLPDYLKPVDLCILPYLMNELTENISPLKLKECLATGKPVVATALPDLMAYQEVVEIANSREEFVSRIEFSLKEDNQLKQIKRQESVSKESWETKVEQMAGYLKEILK